MSENIFDTNSYEHSITVENVSLTFIGSGYAVYGNHTYSEKGLPGMYHNHAHAELFFCKTGGMSLNFGDMEHILDEGDIVFIPPKFLHFATVSKDNTVYNVGLTLTEKTKKENFNAFQKLNSLFSATEPVFFRRYSPVFPEEMTWIENISAASLSLSISAFHALLILAEYYKNHIINEPDINTLGKKVNALMQIENFIGGKYYENTTAEQLSAMLYISPRQLARIVKERYGTSLHQMIIKKRIESAAKLLVESNLSVEEIGSVIGFNTKSCFYKAFRDEYSMTPLQYRKNMQSM